VKRRQPSDDPVTRRDPVDQPPGDWVTWKLLLLYAVLVCAGLALVSLVGNAPG
jgi:hypothetical protein